MAEFSKDYHDYVFRDGKLIAEFESMYRHSKDVPWQQDRQGDWLDVRLAIEMLKDAGPFDQIHDLGCGLGYYLNLMRNGLGAKGCRCFGYDVSETACDKARAIFPDFSFERTDLTNPVGASSTTRALQSGASRLFMIRGTLWYVAPELVNVIKTIRGMMAAGDKLLVVQNFPSADKAFVGKDVIPDHRAIIEHFSSAFVPVRHIWCEDTLKVVNDNWFIGFFALRNSK